MGCPLTLTLSHGGERESIGFLHCLKGNQNPFTPSPLGGEGWGEGKIIYQ